MDNDSPNCSCDYTHNQAPGSQIHGTAGSGYRNRARSTLSLESQEGVQCYKLQAHSDPAGWQTCDPHLYPPHPSGPVEQPAFLSHPGNLDSYASQQQQQLPNNDSRRFAAQVATELPSNEWHPASAPPIVSRLQHPGPAFCETRFCSHPNLSTRSLQSFPSQGFESGSAYQHHGPREEGGYKPQQQHDQHRYPVLPPPAHYIACGQLRLDTRSSLRCRSVSAERGPPMPWTTDIFGFLHDCYGCPLVVLAPCVAFGQIAEITDNGHNSCLSAGLVYAGALLLGIPCFYSYSYRSRLRYRFNLAEDPLDDFCLHFWCELCALGQEYRELAHRGIDPSLGYAMQAQVVAEALAAPIPHSQMQE